MTRAKPQAGVSTIAMPGDVRGVIFDGDDTLWLTEHLYDAARSNARAIVESAGLDGERWEALQRSRDLSNVAKHGHTASRFPTSSVEAFDLVGGLDIVDSVHVREQVWSAAQAVFAMPAPLREGAPELLAHLVARKVRTALLTKGDAAVQWSRICQSGLAERFDAIKVVDHKDANAFTAVLGDLGVCATEAISVGNSIASDIRPSIDAGIAAVWLPAYVWSYELRHDAAHEDTLVQIRSLKELVELLDR